MFSLHPLSVAVCAGLLSAVHAAPATIDISINTSGGSSDSSLGNTEQKSAMVTSSAPIACLAVCYPEEPNCPTPLVVGGGPGCYTCCVDDDKDMSPSTQFPLLHSGKKLHSLIPSLAIKSFELTNKRDACLHVCLEEPDCPEDLYVGGTEGCWTCCLKMDAASKSSVPAKMSLLKDASKTKALSASPNCEEKALALASKNMGEACLMICLEEQPDCQDPSYAKDLGNACWTCCTKFDEDAFSSSSHRTFTAFNHELL